MENRTKYIVLALFVAFCLFIGGFFVSPDHLVLHHLETKFQSYISAEYSEETVEIDEDGYPSFETDY